MVFTAEDSGREGGPIVYRAELPGQTVLTGGHRLDRFVKVTDRDVLSRVPETAREQRPGSD